MSVRARVGIDTVALWRLRTSVVMVRWAVLAVATVGLLATLRFTLSPPRTVIMHEVASTGGGTTGEWFALAFALSTLI